MQSFIIEDRLPRPGRNRLILKTAPFHRSHVKRRSLLTGTPQIRACPSRAGTVYFRATQDRIELSCVRAGPIAKQPRKPKMIALIVEGARRCERQICCFLASR